MNHIFFLVSVLCVLCQVYHVEAFISRGMIQNKVFQSKTSTLVSAKADETDDEMRERLRVKVRKNLYSDKGVAYAPWVTNQIDEDAIIEDAIRKEKEMKTKKAKTSTLDRGEIESSEGMRWRMLEDQVDLAWVTGSESDNKGFIIEKRSSYGGEFFEVASFREVSQLQSKGVSGGRYRFTDPSTAAGSWVYRVKDCDSSSTENVIAQCFVEVQTESESKGQAGIVVGFVGLLIAAAAFGYSLDPPL